MANCQTNEVAPGNPRVDLKPVKSLMQATYVSFASPEIAEELSGASTGAVLSFSFHPSLDLIVEPSLLESDDIFFKAARLDRSMALSSRDHIAARKPRLAAIGLTA